VQVEGRALVPARAALLTWRNHAWDALALVVAAGVGLVVLPMLIDRTGLARSGQPVVGPAWLVVALALSVVVLRAGLALGRKLDAAIRPALERVPPLPRPAGASGPALDIPTTGVLAVRGLLGLAMLFLIQAMLRPALASASDGYAPRALVDGALVSLVAVVALAMFARLHRLSRPLIAHLCRVGLDALVPTAGFAGPGQLPGPRRAALAPPPATQIIAGPGAAAEGASTAAGPETAVTPETVGTPQTVVTPVAAPTVVPPASTQPTVVPTAPDAPTVAPRAEGAVPTAAEPGSVDRGVPPAGAVDGAASERAAPESDARGSG
jgi:hypothetical protein